MRFTVFLFLLLIFWNYNENCYSLTSIPELKIDFSNAEYRYQIEDLGSSEKKVDAIGTPEEGEEASINVKFKKYKIKVFGQLVHSDNVPFSEFFQRTYFDIKLILKDYNNDGIFEAYELHVNTSLNPLKPHFKNYQLTLLKKDGTPEMFLQNIADIEILNLKKGDGQLANLWKSMSNPGDIKKKNDVVLMPDYLPNWINVEDFRKKEKLHMDEIVELLLTSIPLKPDEIKISFPEKIATFVSFKLTMTQLFKEKFRTLGMKIGIQRRMIYSKKDENGNELSDEKLKEIIMETTKLKAELTATYERFQNVDKATTALDILGLLTITYFSKNDLAKGGESNLRKIFNGIFHSESYKESFKFILKTMWGTTKSFVNIFDPRALKDLPKTLSLIWNHKDVFTGNYEMRRMFIQQTVINNAFLGVAIYGNNGSWEELNKNKMKVFSDIVVSNLLNVSFYAAIKKLPPEIAGQVKRLPKTTYADRYMNAMRINAVIGIPTDLALSYITYKGKKQESVFKPNKDDFNYIMARMNFLWRFNAFFQTHFHIMFEEVLHSKKMKSMKEWGVITSKADGADADVDLKAVTTFSDWFVKYFPKAKNMDALAGKLNKIEVVNQLLSDPVAYPLQVGHKILGTSLRLNLRDSILKARDKSQISDKKKKNNEEEAPGEKEQEVAENEEESSPEQENSSVTEQEEENNLSDSVITLNRSDIDELLSKSNGEEKAQILEKINTLYFLEGNKAINEDK